MNKGISTTREQSARLLQCGVDPETCDMFYTNYRTKPNDETPIVKTVPLGIRKDFIPAWSLSALLNLMPRTITHKGRTNIFGLFHEGRKDGGEWNYSCPGIVYFIEDTPFEAVIKMIEWLTANNYKLNEL